MFDLDENNLKLIEKMFEKQNELNTYTNGKNWKNLDLEWYRAIWIECAELINYTNWKWWKQEEIKIDDIKMEIIDIWHFGMSIMLKHNDINECAIRVLYNFENCLDPKIISNYKYNMGLIQTETELLAESSLESQIFDLPNFISLCDSLNMDIVEIYKLYMGKNVLNKFRQDNGYKNKTYTKMWNGKEDNEYLINFIDKINIINDDFENMVYKHLDKLYLIHVNS